MQLSSARAMQSWQTPAQAWESVNLVLNMSCLCDQQDIDKLLHLMMLLGCVLVFFPSLNQNQ